jgi:acyl-CoA thioesterase-1
MDSQRLGFALLAAIVLVFTVTSATVAANPTTMTQPRSIVVLGDSISASYRIQSELGWVNLLNQTLQQRELPWQVINASISGETTGGALARLPGLLAETEPDIVIIELGGNDGLRGYPINKIRQNLERIVDAVVSSGATPLVVAMRIPPNYGDRYANAFDNVFQAVAEDKQSPFVPFLLEEVALSKELMQDDGIHPTAEAQPLLLKAIWPTLEPLL